MKPLTPKDLLDPEKLKQLDKSIAFLNDQKAKKNEAELLKRLDYKDNAESLNRMNTENGKILEWGVEPEE